MEQMDLVQACSHCTRAASEGKAEMISSVLCSLVFSSTRLHVSVALLVYFSSRNDV